MEALVSYNLFIQNNAKNDNQRNRVFQHESRRWYDINVPIYFNSRSNWQPLAIYTQRRGVKRRYKGVATTRIG